MSNVENVCPQALRGVALELRRLAARPPSGVKLLLRDDDLTDVVAIIEGPAETPYAGASFRVRLVLGREFPTAAPRAFFLTRVFHPNVAWATGEVCVDTLRREWRADRGLAHALLALRCLLIAPNADSALNADAAALLRDRYGDYFARAKLLADIHARPAAADSPASAAPARDTRPQNESADGSVGPEDGPCAKRERRPPAGGSAGPAGGRAGPSGGRAGPAGGSAGSGAGPAASARAAAARDKDRRRILKRL